MNPYATHLRLLLVALAATEGDVLELGMGESSTPVLHEICRAMERNLVSYDTDPKYVDEYQRRYGPDSFQHVIHHCGREEWDKAEISKPWAVVLIDHKPAKRRYTETLRLAPYAQVIVCHDTQPENERVYQWGRAFKHFSFRHDDLTARPHTTIVSNFIDVRRVLCT